MKKLALFDVDGTMADLEHRVHHIQQKPKDWKAFYANVHLDKPIEEIIELFKYYQEHPEWSVGIATGRDEKIRTETLAWLSKHGCNPDVAKMRPSKKKANRGTHEEDFVIKNRMLGELRSEGYHVAIVFEDRQTVVDMWRANGIRCCQVDEGNF